MQIKTKSIQFVQLHQMDIPTKFWRRKSNVKSLPNGDANSWVMLTMKEALLPNQSY
jgi:hypothetical protein